MNGCKYPGTPEPCEGYREAMEVLADVKEGIDSAMENLKGQFMEDTAHEIKSSEAALVCLEQALTRIDQLREKK